MKKIIVSIENCQKCAMLKQMAPGVDAVVVKPSEILQFAQAVGIQSMPFVVLVGEPHELADIINGEVK